ncbi:10805_t:CDS:10 [Diversispora eburnea]|uniref:10805_t:CDS:1 n=1 Tax=Diversispora eburnea TaxID=1213867 RepID=A0A9N9BC11_9GLOM|nr:10805_t:CDS:10 [Diversispora eburnea]
MQLEKIKEQVVAYVTSPSHGSSSPLLQLTHGTSSSHGYGLRLCCLQINGVVNVSQGRKRNYEQSSIEETKRLKRKDEADSSNIESTFNSELEPNYDINISNEEILDFDPLSDIESDISETEPDSGLSSVRKYPDEDSPKDIWLLPSGKSIKNIIRGPKNLHMSHLSFLDIIRIGSEVRKPEWIKQEDWDYLNSKFTKWVTFDRENDIEMIFVTDVLSCAKNVFNTTLTFHCINKNEALLGSLMIHPVLQYLRLLRRDLRPDDDKPLVMKVDGSFQFPDERGVEISMVELSGRYLTKDMPRYLKDHVKGYWGCRDLLNDIIIKFKHSDYKILRRLRLQVQIWGMDLNVSKIYRMFLIGTFQFPISWENHHELACAKGFAKSKNDSLKVFEELKKSHCRNTLKSYIGDAKSSPQKPIGKNHYSCDGIIDILQEFSLPIYIFEA